MGEIKRRRNAAMLLICAALFVTMTFTAFAQHDHEGKEQAHEHTASSPDSGTSPLMEEMQILDGVFREVVSAVALNDGDRIEKALHSMHGTMEKTHEGIHHGTVKLSRNADKLETFVTMDKEFHGKLDKLATAAKKDDQQAMVKLTKDLLDRCVKCHGMFR